MTLYYRVRICTTDYDFVLQSMTLYCLHYFPVGIPRSRLAWFARCPFVFVCPEARLAHNPGWPVYAGNIGNPIWALNPTSRFCFSARLFLQIPGCSSEPGSPDVQARPHSRQRVLARMICQFPASVRHPAIRLSLHLHQISYKGKLTTISRFQRFPVGIVDPGCAS